MLQLIKEMVVIHTKKKHLKSNVLSSGTAESVAKHLPPTIKIPHFFSHLKESMTIRSISIQFSLQTRRVDEVPSYFHHIFCKANLYSEDSTELQGS